MSDEIRISAINEFPPETQELVGALSVVCGGRMFNHVVDALFIVYGNALLQASDDFETFMRNAKNAHAVLEINGRAYFNVKGN